MISRSAQQPVIPIYAGISNFSIRFVLGHYGDCGPELAQTFRSDFYVIVDLYKDWHRLHIAAQLFVILCL